WLRGGGSCGLLSASVARPVVAPVFDADRRLRLSASRRVCGGAGLQVLRQNSLPRPSARGLSGPSLQLFRDLSSSLVQQGKTLSGQLSSLLALNRHQVGFLKLLQRLSDCGPACRGLVFGRVSSTHVATVLDAKAGDAYWSVNVEFA